MGLEIFNKQEKVEDEKKLETVQTKEGTIDEIIGYFENSKPSEHIQYEKVDEIFYSILTSLNSFRISQGEVGEVWDILTKKGLTTPYKNGEPVYEIYAGIFLSALIQTSYNQGYNNFKFEEVPVNFFGVLLKGKKKNPLSVEIETLRGEHSFEGSKHCKVKVHLLDGYGNFWGMKHSKIQITTYRGKQFGWDMENCQVYSPGPELPSRLEDQSATETNKFIVGEMP